MSSQKLQFFLLFFIWASLLACLSHDVPGKYSILGYELDKYPSEERVVVELFQRWKKEHGRFYRHPEEAAMRLGNFKRNLRYVVEQNAMRTSPNAHRLGLNRFADMSNEEFRRTYFPVMKRPIKRSNSVTNGGFHLKDNSCEDAPSSLDWRKKGVVTGVKDQQDCGSCWAFSSTGAMEGINALVTGKLTSLSEQELVDCDTTNDGCEGGDMDYAFEWVINNGGIDTETNYPYTGKDGTCNITKERIKVVSVDGYQDVAQTETAVLCAVAKQPISAGMDGSAMDFQLYTGGIYDGKCSSNPDDIDHAVLIVGYGSEDGDDYWIVKNSWGTDWGLDGYFLLKRNGDEKYGKCAIDYMASYPTKESSAPSPSSPPPPVTPPPPPPPPSPSPSECGDFSYCAADQTCCCTFELLDFCLIYGCCDYENAVCCSGTDYCCPSDYPVCDVEDGLCLQNSGDVMGVAAKKKKIAKHKFPWSKIEGEAGQRKTYSPLELKRNPFSAAMR
ncbi:low-temperature-induced cysteine proteinase-like isoform X2 [Prosopis cineraria]|uniref:low-temperature-induced cysteine proteinase-like isoform X2 n=1 Tax=Prosopis cineraria TaxID=364024 RepID=UPI00241081E1|nr:low-temperature-induced cysteine proteinase-like isoform X2 [Prosopis cineraria]